jgi:hypothetical protein
LKFQGVGKIEYPGTQPETITRFRTGIGRGEHKGPVHHFAAILIARFTYRKTDRAADSADRWSSFSAV